MSPDRPVPGPLPAPVPDPRSRDMVIDYAGMHVLVADLVLPGDASMCVMSALETSRELIRHCYYRYEFATVAVTHSLFALEHILAERLAVNEPLQAMIERAVEAGLIPTELGAELERNRLLRDGVARGAVTSAALTPAGAIAGVRAVFDAVAQLLRSPTVAEAAEVAEAATGGPGGAQPENRLARLWEDDRRAPFPAGFRGVDIEVVELILLDADVAGLVQRELDGGLDGNGVDVVWACIAGLDKIVPLINEEYCAAYFKRLRTVAGQVASRYLPAAT